MSLPTPPNILITDIHVIVSLQGAMENKGLNIFNSAYVLADPNTATDADYEVGRMIS